jgi:hypothetical protein
MDRAGTRGGSGGPLLTGITVTVLPGRSSRLLAGVTAVLVGWATGWGATRTGVTAAPNAARVPKRLRASLWARAERSPERFGVGPEPAGSPPGMRCPLQENPTENALLQAQCPLPTPRHKEGDVGAGDPIDLVPTKEQAVSVAEIAALYTADRDNHDLLQLAVRPGLPEGWRDHFRKRLWEADA